MSRKFWISFISIVILSLMACAKKGDTSMNDTEIKDTELKEENKYLATNFIGDSGYITENMIYDYSAFFDEVYEWAEGIKMPVPMPEGGKVAWQTSGEYSYSNPMLQHVSKSELEIALEPLKDKGFIVYMEDDDNGEKTTYSVYKENFRIVFSYDSYNENQWNVFAYMGNVIHERAVTREDAINMIEDSELLKNDEYFEKYYVFAIETESIREAGYFEFYVVPIYYLGEKAQSWMPYYMITDGDGVLFFEKGALNHIWPSNANIVETTEGAELIISGMPDYGTNMYWSYEVSGYRIEDGKFEKIWSHSSSKNYDVDTTKQGVVSRVNNGQIEYYLVEAQKDYDCSMGRKDFWQIKEKYFINKLKVTDNKEENSYLAKDYLGEENIRNVEE